MNLAIAKTNPKEASLLALAVFNISLLLFRMAVTRSLFYGFLIWNLTLAGVPFIISFLMEENPRMIQRKIPFCILSFAWLLFLPNAPYIITDFLHFKLESTMPEWFDVLLLTSFSWSGIALGLLSMRVMHRIWEEKFSVKAGWVFIFTCSLLSGIGIYIGRYLRFNSWDIISNPVALLTDVPFLLLEIQAVGFSVGYGLLVFLFYSFFKINTKTL